MTRIGAITDATSAANLVANADVQRNEAQQDAILKRASGAKEDLDKTRIKEVAEQFESLFLDIVVKSMRNSVQKSGLISGGNAEDIYASMLDQEYTKMMAAQRSTGLADSIERSILEAYGGTLPGESGEGAAAARYSTAKALGSKAYQAQKWTPPENPATIKPAAISMPPLSPLSIKSRAF